MAMNNESMESLLKAMDIIASRKVEKVAYDSTIICTIVDNSDRKNGCYTVTDGTIKFQAYSEVTTYKVDDQVRVSIPNGDYTQEKYIEGKYVSDNNTSPITYTSPLGSVVDMAALAGPGTQTSISGNLIANYIDPANPTGIQLYSWQFNTGDNKSEFADLQQNNIYDTIYLRADFKSLLNNRKMRGGSYGLRLDMRVRTNSTNHPYITKSLYLDSSEMFGNPYAFTVFSTQEKKFDISPIGIIDSMTLYFYQNNDFIYFNGKENIPIPVEKTVKIINGAQTRVPTENLFVNNVYLGFGSDISAITDNTIQLYSSDDMNFKHYEPSDTTNQKTLRFLWYNKTESNKYIGFSDGLVTRNEDGSIFEYDEIDYLNASEVDARLMAQKGKSVPTDKIGLDAAASIEEAEPILKECSRLITSDLTNTFKSFKDRLRGLTDLQKIIDTLLTSSNDTVNFPKLGKELGDYTEKIISYFSKQLKYAAAVQAYKKDGTEIPEGVSAQVFESYWDKPDADTDIVGVFNRLEQIIYNKTDSSDRLVDFMPQIRNAIKEKYQGFQGIYDTYATRVDKIFNTLKENQIKLNSLLSGKEKIISNYNENYEFIEYIQPDLSHLNNRYCVYWYRYVKGYEDADERFMDKEWQRFTPEYQFKQSQDGTLITLKKNIGLPSDTTMDGTTEYLVAKPTIEEGSVTLFLDPNLKEEKFVVVVFYNHEIFKSGELIFTNSDEFEDFYSVDKSNAVYIEHGNNSMDSFQSLYGATNFLNNSKDANVVRELRVRYNGLSHKDEALAGAHVYWYVPNNTTMLKVDVDNLQTRGFMTDCYPTAKVIKACSSYKGPSEKNYNKSKEYSIDDNFTIYGFNSGYYSLTKKDSIGNTSSTAEWIAAENIEILRSEYYREGYTCFYKQIGSKDIVTEEWDPELNTNVEVTTTTCEEKDTYFYYKIKDYYSPTFLRNMIFCYIEKEGYPFEADIQLAFSTLGTSGTDYTLMVVPVGTQTAVQGSDINLPLLINLYDYNNEPINMYTKFDNNGVATEQTGSPGQAFNARVEWMGPTTYDINLLSNEEDKTVQGGEALINGNALNDNSITPDMYCGIAKVITSFGLGKSGQTEDEENAENESSNKKYRIVDLTTVYPIAWSIGDYYIEGATTVVYDSYGKNPSYYKDPFRIFKANSNEELSIGGLIGEEKITAVDWELKYFVGEDKELPSTLVEGNEAYRIYMAYMPVINDKNGLTPCNMYIGNINCYPVAQCYITTEKTQKTLYWSQPIAIIQNRYPSAMLNAWDGSLTIDEKNGTILSSMIGAGRKSADNTFEGVLMGDIAGSTGMDLENKTGLGLYGFHDGSQSFGMNIDGTAFFGKSGRGRIKFNGDKGTITSASYEQLKNTGDSGMLIDLDDGIIDMYGIDWDGVNDNNAPNYKLSDTHPHIRLSTTATNDSPYFLITTPNINFKATESGTPVVNWDGKELIYIGLDGYFLQSENYTPGSYSTEEGKENMPGIGTKLDLQNGKLDAYNLLITSKNIYIDSTENADPYFTIKDDHGHNLFYAGVKKYYLKTCNYNERVADENDVTTTYGTGIKIDLQNNKIDAYDFMIRGESSGETTGGSYILLDSTAPQFVVHLKKSGTDPLVDLDLIKVSANEFMLHSANWNVTTSTDTTKVETATCANGYNVRSGPGTNYSIIGTTGSNSKTVTIYEKSTGQGSDAWYRIGEGEWVASGAISNIQISTGGTKSTGSGMEINMNNGCITAYNRSNAGKNLVIDSGASNYPIQLGTIDNYNLKLGWDGSLQGGTTYTWSITSSGKATFNSMTVNSGSFNGYIYASGGTIGGCKISSGSISGTNWSLNNEGRANFTGITVDGYDLNVITIQAGATAKVAASQPSGVYSGYSVVTNIGAAYRDKCYVVVNGNKHYLESEGKLPITRRDSVSTCYIWNGSTPYRVVGATIKT